MSTRIFRKKHGIPFIYETRECPQSNYEVDEDTICQALEKQTPKKPKMRHFKPYDSYNDGWCPCCEAYVQELEYDTQFCQVCGQTLDWNNNSEDND